MADEFEKLGAVPVSETDQSSIKDDPFVSLGAVPVENSPVHQPGVLEALLSKAQGPLQTYSDYMKNVINTGTMGLANKGAAALKAGIDKLQGNPEAYSALFGQHQAEGEQDIANTEKSSPIASTLGKVSGVGGQVLAGGPAIEGVGAALGRQGIVQAAKQGLVPLAGEIGLAGVEGAGLGAIQGAASTKGNYLTDEGQQQAFNDIKTGGELGGLVGGGLAALGAGVVKGAQAAEPLVRDIPYLRQLVVATKTGNTAIGDEARTALVNGEKQTAQDLTANVVNGDKILGQNIEDVVKKATNDGITIELDNYTANEMKKYLMDNRGRLSPKSFKSLMNQVSDFELNNTKEGISPIDINTFKKEFQQATSGFSNTDSIDMKNAILDGINTTLDSIPGYKQANELFHDYRNSLAEPLLNEGSNNPKYLSDMANWPEALSNKFQDMFQKLGFSKESANDYLQSLSKVKNNLEAFSEKYPGELEKLGLDPDQLVKTIKSQADVSGVRIRQTGEVAGNDILSKAAGVVTGAPMSGAALVGRATRGGARLINRFNTASPEELQAAGQRLVNDPDLKFLGDSLLKSIQTNNNFLKNAAIFKILQNPRAREILGGHSDEN